MLAHSNTPLHCENKFNSKIDGADVMQGLATRGTLSPLALSLVMWLVAFQKRSRRIATSALMRSDWSRTLGGRPRVALILCSVLSYLRHRFSSSSARPSTINGSHASRIV